MFMVLAWYGFLSFFHSQAGTSHGTLFSEVEERKEEMGRIEWKQQSGGKYSVSSQGRERRSHGKCHFVSIPFSPNRMLSSEPYHTRLCFP